MPNVADPEDFLLSQDIIFVGGGSVANMIAVWRVHGIDEILRKAWQAGIVLAGSSAGGICWFEGGTTDSFGARLRPYTDALGMLPGSFCPHYNSEAERRPLYQRLVAEGALPGGLACDDGVGAHYVDDSLDEMVADHPDRGGYRVEPDGRGRLHRDPAPGPLPRRLSQPGCSWVGFHGAQGAAVFAACRHRPKPLLRRHAGGAAVLAASPAGGRRGDDPPVSGGRRGVVPPEKHCAVGHREPVLAAWCNNIGFVTVSLTTSESAPETAEADILVIGVVSTPAGPAAAPGLAGVDEALGGTLAETLAALGATGEIEEISKIPGGGKLPATLVLAVGLGPAPADGALLRRGEAAAGGRGGPAGSRGESRSPAPRGRRRVGRRARLSRSRCPR